MIHKNWTMDPKMVNLIDSYKILMKKKFAVKIEWIIGKDTVVITEEIK